MMADVIHDLIHAAAATKGDRVALVVDGAGSHTYRELAERAVAVSAGLRARGVRHGDLVALLFPTVAWLDYACALFGVLNAGAAAVVLSDGATDDELRHIARYCKLRAVLTGRPRELPDIAGWQCELAAVETGQRADPPTVDVQPGDLAMVLHTSGTTGRPKGVPLTHAHLALPALKGAPEADHPAERVLALFPIASTAGQMFFARELGCANTLHLMPEFDTDRFCAIVERERIERVNLVPAMGHWLARSGKHKTTTLTTPWSVMFSSAPLPVAVLREMRALFPHARLENFYSSTELAPGMVTTVVDPARPNSVGKPLDAFELRITDETGTALPAGEQGEVRMRVPGITGRRYLGDAAASTRTFDGDWVRTGDIGYLDEDGYLYLVERASDVLNPGGRKVAPSEVEAVLAEHPAVVECAVFGMPHPVLDQLVAAAVVAGSAVTVVELKRFARERLTDYKVPVAIYFVESLPRNEIGKVQRSKLANLLQEAVFAPAPSSRGATEQRLAGLWRSLLDLDKEPEGRSNFFAIGGHSLVTAQLAREIVDVFGVTPTMLGLFDHATLAEQAAYLDTLAADPPPDRPELERLADDKVAPWSYLQEYMWAAKQRCPNPGWNVLLTIRLRGRLDVAAVRDAITFLVRRHEILRTRLDDTGQQEDDVSTIELPVTDLTGAADPQRELAEICRAQHGICLDLGHGPAVVPVLVRVAADEHVLMLTMDHASCDGWSAGIVLREFAATYDALVDGGEPDLPALPVRYRDFAAYQRELVAAGAFDAELDYWQRQLAGLPAEPMLPRRADAPASPGYHSGLRALDIDRELADAVRNRARSADHTVFMILLGTLMASIAAVSGRSDVVVATLSAGRHRTEIQGVVGMFANPLLLRVDVAAAATHRELFDAVRAATVDAHDHGTMPFPVVAERVGQRADRPEVWFNMAPPMSLSSTRKVAIEPSDIPRNYVITVPAAGWRGENLLVNGIDTGKSMHMEFDYNTELVDAATIERLCATYLDLLHAVTRDWKPVTTQPPAG